MHNISQNNNKDSTFDIGKKGEEIAIEFLKGKNYTILDTNWRSGQKEIDIIAQDKKEVVIIEVKSRASTFLVSPESAVNKQKQRILIQAANHYVSLKNIQNEIRFDIISIVYSGSGHIIEHLENAFYPEIYKGYR